jgi:predicted phage baseplate assembly protein
VFRAPAESPEHCAARQPVPVLPRFRPFLAEGPLTQTGTVRRVELVDGQARERILAFDPEAPAADALRWRMADVLPAIALSSTGTVDRDWSPRRDLLDSDAFSADFVAEVEDDGIAALRFGDDEYGIRPEPGTAFTATYRVGNGAQGNVGARAIAHIVSPDGAITAVENPLPAAGGVEPETLEHVRQSAPSAFRVQQRAVTEADWAEVTQRREDVQRAAATFRWTGSWHTVFATVDRAGGLAVDAPFRQDLRAHLESFRVVGHDLEVDGPRFVGLRLAMTVCVEPEYFRADVERELRDIFSTGTFPDGRRGLFHPDALTFGQPVYLSPLYAAAQSVEGVHSVEITALERLTARGGDALATGKLALGRLEIARLDNDPDFPERGILELTLEGGR